MKYMFGIDSMKYMFGIDSIFRELKKYSLVEMLYTSTLSQGILLRQRFHFSLFYEGKYFSK